MPASKPSVRARYAIAGVGTTPALDVCASSPSGRAPAPASIHVARLARVASDQKPRRCPVVGRQRLDQRRANPRHRLPDPAAIAPALPRMPSVPNSVQMRQPFLKDREFLIRSLIPSPDP